MATLQNRTAALSTSVSNTDCRRPFLFSFPSIGLRHSLSSNPLPRLLPFIIQNLPEALRLEGEILGQLLRAPNYKTKRWLVVAKFPVTGCTPLHFRKNVMLSCSFTNSILTCCHSSQPNSNDSGKNRTGASETTQGF